MGCGEHRSGKPVVTGGSSTGPSVATRIQILRTQCAQLVAERTDLPAQWGNARAGAA